MATKEITEFQVTAWHLEYREGSSNKFYRVYVTENGLTVLKWGRIRTHGQSSFSTHSDYTSALDAGLKQVYEKRAKGYQQIHEIQFTGTITAIRTARGGDPSLLDREYQDALNSGSYETAKVEVLKHYAAFSEQIQSLLGRAQYTDLAELLDQYEQVEQAWAEIDDKHREVTAAMQLTKAALMTKLVGS